MLPVISADSTWLLLAIIAAGAALSILLEQRTRWGARLSGPVVALGLAMLLSNTRLIPTNAPAYDVVDDYFVPVAVPLLLFRANVRKIFRETGQMFGAFHVACLGTMLGALLATVLFGSLVPRVAEVAGIMTGSYTGGAVNFVALANTYGVPSELSNPLLVADNFIMAAIFGALLMLARSRWMRRHYPHPHSPADGQADSQALAAKFWQRKEISLLDLALGLAVAVAIAAVALHLTGLFKERISSRIVLSMVGNPFVWITLLTVAVVSLLPRWTENIRGTEELGMYFLYLFFFVIGVRADLPEVVKNVPVLFGFCAVMAVTNLAFTLLVGRMLRLNLEELLLSVNASLGGAPSAAAMAISCGWSNLVLPGLLAGIWGYVIGTFLGIVICETLRQWF